MAVPTRSRNNAHPVKDSNTARGSYVLLMSLSEEQIITVGSLGSMSFSGGRYAYVGSALGGFESRLSRYLRTSKKPRWHIDYLLEKAELDAIIIGESPERTECTIALALARHFDPVPGFGASDCHCRSHLFFGADDMMTAVASALEGAGLKPRLKYIRGQH